MLALEDSDKNTTGLAVEGFLRDKDPVILDTHISFVTMNCPSPHYPPWEEKEPVERGEEEEEEDVTAATTSTPVRRESTGFIAVPQVPNE